MCLVITKTSCGHWKQHFLEQSLLTQIQGFALTIFFFRFYNSVKFDLNRVKSRCELNSNFLCLTWEMWKKAAPGTSSLSTGSQYWHSKPLITPAHLKITPFPNAETQLHHPVGKQESLTSKARAVACAEAIPCSQTTNNTDLIDLWPGTLTSVLRIWLSGGPPIQSMAASALPDLPGHKGCRLKPQVPGSMWEHLQSRSSKVLFAFVLQIKKFTQTQHFLPGFSPPFLL